MIRKTVLTTIALLALLCVRVQAAPTPESVIKETIVKHSIEMNVDPALALSRLQTRAEKSLRCSRSFPAASVYCPQNGL